MNDISMISASDRSLFYDLIMYFYQQDNEKQHRPFAFNLADSGLPQNTERMRSN